MLRVNVIPLLILFPAAVVSATEVADPEPTSASMCSEPVRLRLDFIETRLDERRDYADDWWRTWTGVYGVATIFQSVRAGFEDDRGDRADLIVSAVKAFFGTARLLYDRPLARQGADPVRAMSVTDETSCAERLAFAEEVLRENAEEAHSRWSWKRHVGNIAVNVAGALIVSEGFDDTEDAWISATVGMVVGELQIFTFPWSADDDLAEYEREFGAYTGAPTTWSVTAWTANGPGLGVTVRY